MVVDSAAEVHLVCAALKHFMNKRDGVACSVQPETAGGDVTLDTIGDLLCGGIVCHGSAFNTLLIFSHFSIARGEVDGYFDGRRPKGDGVLKGPNGM